MLLVGIAVLFFSFCFGVVSQEARASIVLDAVSLQVHNPASGPPGSLESDAKSQFIMRNDSDPGVKINSILWNFASGVFLDTTSDSPGYGSYLDYQVSPAQTYNAGFDIVVGANSDTTVGYSVPGTTPKFANGATSLLLSFNNFDPGEAFAFWTDLDSTGDTTGRVRAPLWIGTTTAITFSNGCVKNYTWSPSGNGVTFGLEKACVNCEVPDNVVPEPATMSLLGLGLLGLFGFKKHKK